MRHFRKSFVALVTTAAVLAPAGFAATSQADPLVEVEIYNVANGNTVQVLNIEDAAIACGIQVVQITAGFAQGQDVNCNSQPGKKIRPH